MKKNSPAGFSLRTLLPLCAAVLFSFAVGRMLAAQNWQDPQNNSPIGNPGQPPILSDFSAYARKTVTALQKLSGPLNVGQGTSLKSYIADQDGTKKTAVIGSTASILGYPDGNTGIYAYGTQYGVYGVADGDGAAPERGVAGEAGNSSAYAARFLGPVEIIGDPVNAAPGTLYVSGSVAASRGFVCDDTLAYKCTAQGFSATHATLTAVDSTAATLPGIEVAMSDGTAENGTAVLGYPEGSYGIAGLGSPGIYAKAEGAGASYIGIFGYDTGFSNSRGIYGVSEGGLGSANYGSSPAPSYDPAAGVRACVKNAAGVPQNQLGIYGSGGNYAGYFNGDGSGDSVDDGDMLITDRPGVPNTGRLWMGGIYLTKDNLKGILCKSGNAQYC